MDLSKLSDQDLIALKSKDYSKLSNNALMMLKSAQQPEQSFDPTEGMSGGKKLLAGAGKAFVDIGRGVGQRLGLVSDEDVQRARELDAPLMQTGAGVTGNILGNMAALAPTAMIPGANTLVGGAITGAGLGLLQPKTKDESLMKNMAMGGATGAVLPAVIGGVSAAKAGLYDPLVRQDKIIGSTLTKVAGSDAQKLANMLKTSDAGQTPNVRLSAGTVSGNEGIAALEDALRSQMPSGSLAQAGQSNRNALAEALRGIAQTPEAMEAAQNARNAASTPIYDVVKSQSFAVDPELQTLMQRPAVQNAIKEAQINAMNRGAPIMAGESPTIQGDALHEIKMALDAAKNYNPMGGANKAQSGAIGEASNAFNTYLEGRIPEYAQARQTYAQMSKPINQMEIGKKLAEKLIPATAGDMPASLNYATLAKSMQNPDIVAQSATGFKGARMSDIMTPEQLNLINAVTSDSSKIAEALRRGAGQGSPTARRLAQGDMISQYFAQEAPITSRVLAIANKVPGVNVATKGASAIGGMIGDKANAQMLGRIDDMLANNPQEVAKLIQAELSRVNPTQRQMIIRALPQSVVLSLPQSVNAMQQ